MVRVMQEILRETTPQPYSLEPLHHEILGLRMVHYQR